MFGIFKKYKELKEQVKYLEGELEFTASETKLKAKINADLHKKLQGKINVLEKEANKANRKHLQEIFKEYELHKSLKAELTKEYQHNVELKSEIESLKERLAKHESPREVNTNTGEKFIFFD